MQTLKSVGTWLALFLSLYILAPTVLRLSEVKEKYTASGQAWPWYYAWLPSQEINLGLDLRGGLYVEMEVDVEEALDHNVNSILSDIRRFALQDEFKSVALERVGKNAVRIEIEKNQINGFQEKLTRIFGPKQFNLSNAENEIFFSITGDADTARKTATEALLKQSADPTQALNAIMTSDKKHIGIPAVTEEQKKSILQLFATPELSAMFNPSTPENIVYLQLTEENRDRLKKDIIEQASKSVRNRIDRFGVAEANVSRQGSDRLVIELPGAKDATPIIDLVKTTGKLEFRLVNKKWNSTALKTLVDTKAKDLKIDNVYEEEQQKTLNASLKAELPENTEIIFSIERDKNTNKVILYTPYLVEKQADVTGDMIETATVQTQNGKPSVSMTFNALGAQKFGEVTSKNVGHELAIVLDNVVTSAPNIQGAIMGGQAQITLGYGSYDTLHKEAQDLAMILKEGALPASLKVASKNSVGPSLGQDSIDAGLRSILISGALVFFFMLLYYRLGGLIANIALVLNVLFMFALLTLMGASLTLPGMAGIVLTMGMAVDANVIIFERMREEQKLRHNISAIVDSAYNSAFSAILDGNITTFIAGMFLFEYGTGPIKGFATTLMIGIVTTLFTAVVVTRLIYDWMIRRLKIKSMGF